LCDRFYIVSWNAAAPAAIPVSASVRGIAAAHERWGRGAHQAGLNLGDCFSYEAAKEHSCPSLYVGDDFSKTDLERAL
jgi:ribonuclease VapC